MRMCSLGVITRKFGAKRHRRIKPGCHFGLPASLQIRLEIRRYLYRKAEFTISEATIELRVTGNGRMLIEVVRSTKTIGVKTASWGSIKIQNRKGQMVHVEGYSIAEHNHQKNRAQYREHQAHGIMA